MKKVSYREKRRAGARAANLMGPSVYQGGGAKFEIKHKVTVFKGISSLIGGGQNMSIGEARPPLAPVLGGSQ